VFNIFNNNNNYYYGLSRITWNSARSSSYPIQSTAVVATSTQ